MHLVGCLFLVKLIVHEVHLLFTSIYFSDRFLAGGLMTLLMVFVFLRWGNGRSSLPSSRQTASDYRMVGYFFFGMATYTLCPLLGVKTFALSPEKMIEYGLQGEAASFALHLLIELLLGWTFIALSVSQEKK